MYSIFKRFLTVSSLLIIALVLTTKVYANEFRHKDVKQKKQGYLYITIALNFPLTNSVNKVNEIFNSDFYKEIVINSGQLYTNKDTYPAQKIGAMAGFGYKLPYFLRLEMKLDFLTFTKKYYSSYQGITFENPVDMTVRQFGALVYAYLDLDNSTFITPFVGAGAGVAFVNGSFFSRNASIAGSTILAKYSGNLMDKNFPVYEFAGGFRFGGKIASFTFECFVRKIPAVELTSKGAMLKLSFQI